MLIRIRYTAVAGFLIFGALLVFVQAFPKTFERTAIGFIQQQVHAKVVAAQPVLASDGVKAGLQKIADKLGEHKAKAAELRDGPLKRIIGEIVAAKCGCTQTNSPLVQKTAGILSKALDQVVETAGRATARVSDLINEKYTETAEELRADLSIFLATNLIAFVSVFAITFMQLSRAQYVVYPALLLLVTVAVCSGLYLFNTNWLYTILFQDYYGYGYATLIGVIYLFLIDIFTNKARMTSFIFNSIGYALHTVC